MLARAIVLLGLVGCAGPPEVGRFERTVELAPGELVEIQLAVTGDAELALRVTGDGRPVYWDLHRHDGDEVIIVDQGQGPAVDASIAVGQTDRYWFMVANQSGAPTTVDIEVDLSGAAAVEAWLFGRL